MSEVVWTELDEIERRGERLGERRGQRRGKRLGERSGRAKQLLSLLAARFGSVPAKVAAHVEAADGPTLDRWAVRVLTAATLQEVIAEEAVDAGRSPPSRRRPSAPARPRHHAR